MAEEEIGFIAGHSKRNAQRALAAADAVHIAQWRVRSVREGYNAPQSVVDEYQRMLEEETASEATETEEIAAPESTTIEGAGVTTAKVSDEGAAPVAEKVAPASDDVPADNDDWTHAKLDKFAKKHKIELAKGLNKTDKVAAILAATANKEE